MRDYRQCQLETLSGTIDKIKFTILNQEYKYKIDCAYEMFGKFFYFFLTTNVSPPRKIPRASATSAARGSWFASDCTPCLSNRGTSAWKPFLFACSFKPGW
jgi:hypothetical protein